MRRIDCHQHFWSLERGDYDWLSPDLPSLYRDYLPKDLNGLRSSSGINSTILVQAAPTIEETNYLLSLADEYNFIAGVVGWVEMESEKSVQNLIKMSESSKFKGIRPMVQDMPSVNWLLKPELEIIVNTLTELNLTFDALVRPVHLSVLGEFVHRHPGLSIVIDHAAKPNITGGDFSKWAKAIEDISEFKNVYCKISGLLTEAKIGASADDLKPWVDHLVRCFGSQRLMWGSDWPVLNLASDYKSWVRISEALFANLSREEKQNVFGGTACAFYKL